MTRERTAGELGARRQPVQARSKRSVESIFDAAVDVLDERGLPGFTTKAVAATAGLNVATLYQYFPNKQALLAELADHVHRRRARRLVSLLDDFSQGDDWEPLVGKAVDALVTLRRTDRASAVIRRALAASPDLVARHRANLVGDAEAIRLGLIDRVAGLDPSRARAIGVVFAAATDAAVEVACSSRRVDRAIVREHVAMLVAHLHAVLDGARTAGPGDRVGAPSAPA